MCPRHLRPTVPVKLQACPAAQSDLRHRLRRLRGQRILPQALSPLIAANLHATPTAAALLVTTTQLGYAAGLYLLVPLGDRVRPRPLIVTLIILTAAGLVAAGPLRPSRSSWWRGRRSASPPWCRRSCCRWPPGWSRTGGAAR